MAEYSTMLTGDMTAAYTILYFSMAILVITVAAVVGVSLYGWKHRNKSKTWYLDVVYAYKAGFIIKKAKDQEIELVYPPKSDLGQKLEEEVSEDLNTP